MTKQLTKFNLLLILALLFAAPGISAYFFYKHPDLLGSSRVNKGTLLNPPFLLNGLDKSTKWRLILWSPTGCSDLCMKQLDQLARVRLAMGRKLYQVELWLILGDKAPAMDDQTQALLDKEDFHIVQSSTASTINLSVLTTKAQLFIANPDNYVILSYLPKANPEDIYKDLKLLLNSSEHKSG